MPRRLLRNFSVPGEPHKEVTRQGSTKIVKIAREHEASGSSSSSAVRSDVSRIISKPF